MSSPFDCGRPSVWCEKDGLSLIPKSPGAYRFVRVDSRSIDYIGITSNLYNRLSNHRSTNTQYDPDLHRVVYQVARSEADWAKLCDWEARKIGVHRPPLNKTSGKNGRVAKQYLEEIEVEVEVTESIEDAMERNGLFSRLVGLFRR